MIVVEWSPLSIADPNVYPPVLTFVGKLSITLIGKIQSLLVRTGRSGTMTKSKLFQILFHDIK